MGGSGRRGLARVLHRHALVQGSPHSRPGGVGGQHADHVVEHVPRGPGIARRDVRGARERKDFEPMTLEHVQQCLAALLPARPRRALSAQAAVGGQQRFAGVDPARAALHSRAEGQRTRHHEPGAGAVQAPLDGSQQRVRASAAVEHVEQGDDVEARGRQRVQVGGGVAHQPALIHLKRRMNRARAATHARN